MGKRWSPGLFCFTLLIAFDSAFAAQTEPITEKDKSRIRKSSASRPARAYPWKTNIVTTVFWIGEQSGGNNLVPNRTSAWDKQWTKSYGGFDDPNPAHRGNDKAHTGHRPEAPRVVPWFQEAYRGSAVSTCKDRWVAIRKRNRIAYAQWEDAGPFRTDHWQYVFGNERPKPNLNKGAGLDVSPAVRDYLGLKQTDITDWRFVDFNEVSRGPWATLGENNAFVINSRIKDVKVTERLGRNEVGVITR